MFYFNVLCKYKIMLKDAIDNYCLKLRYSRCNVFYFKNINKSNYNNFLRCPKGNCDASIEFYKAFYTWANIITDYNFVYLCFNVYKL